jgi:chemotaxis protein MotA
MLFFIGLTIVVASVITGYVFSHGHLAVLWQPFEMIIIIGSAFGAFIISNPWHIIKAVFKNVPRVMLGSRFKKSLYMDVLALVFDVLSKSRREGMMAIESDVEDPTGSPIFSIYPRILSDAPLLAFIVDYFRIISAGNMAAHELEALMDMEIETRQHELEMPSGAVGKVADALPGFGIVAAVLGIVITMGAIGGEPAELGKHVAAALIGTFLGILLAYGMVGPLSSAMEHQAQEEIKLYESVKAAMIAAVNGMPPQLAVEFGRKILYYTERPTFYELEEHVRADRS